MDNIITAFQCRTTISFSGKFVSRISSYKTIETAPLFFVNGQYALSSTVETQELRHHLSRLQPLISRCEQFAAPLNHRITDSACQDRHSGLSISQFNRKNSSKHVNAVVDFKCTNRVASSCKDDVQDCWSPDANFSGGALQAAQCTFDRIQAAGIIACLRSQSAEVALDAGRAALDGGLSVLEVTMRTPGAAKVMERLVNEYPRATIGAGTVLTWQDAQMAKAGGAKFLMSPVTHQELVQAHWDSHVLFIPGAMTPTEVFGAFKRGASCVKLYPLSLLGGKQYVQMLKTAYPFIPLIASNGMTLDMVESYLCAGASAVVLSNDIFDKMSMAKHDYAQISQQSKAAALSAMSARVNSNIPGHF